MFKRGLLIVLDSVGIGAMPDCRQFGDTPSVNTLRNICKSQKGLSLPNLASLGLGTLGNFEGLNKIQPAHGIAIKCAEESPGKDTTIGHWEMAGLVSDKAFPQFPNGFSKNIIDRFIKENNLPGILGNKPASGTDILKELGEEHCKTGKPIVYTSADSVFQIACHEETFGLEKLYQICKSARHLCDELGLARVIARPFLGNTPATFKRTSNRKDYSLAVPGKLLFNYLVDKNIQTRTIGKISNIFDHQGIASNIAAKNNLDGLEKLESLLKEKQSGLIAINLVDFDQNFGHRRDPEGYANALKEFDVFLPRLLRLLNKDDILVITADHGNDPTAPGTDHTREHVPVLVYSPGFGPSKSPITRKSFTCVGATLFEALTDEKSPFGVSLMKDLKKIISAPLTPAHIIAKKRNKKKLTPDEIIWFVKEFSAGEIADYQMAALLMAIFINGMDATETAALTDAMLYSGEVLEFTGKNVVDKHSTGGIGDKTSFILAAIAAAAGVNIPMVSGRGLGHTGGTVDKLESIPGFRTSLSLEEFKKQLDDIGVVMVGQTADIAPADKRIYALRDVTSTVESIPLITASIMSKKLASGIQGLVLDVKTGNGAFMKKEADSVKLAKSLMATAHRFGKSCVAFITDMGRPLGRAVGNAIEIIESIETLKGKGPEDITTISAELAGAMIYSAGLAPSLKKGTLVAREMIASGKALEKFRELIRAQGGDERIIDDYSLLKMADTKTLVLAPKSGYLASFACERIGNMVTDLGGGRKVAHDKVDTSVGILFTKTLGDKLKKDEVIATLFHHPHQQELATRLANELATKVITITPKKSLVPKLIKKILI
jgi:phosphopentomutase